MECDFLTLAAMDDTAIDVKSLRDALGWTQQQLADYCGSDRSTVSKWENEPPAKGPALVLLRQLRSSINDAAPLGGVAAGPVPQAGTGQPLVVTAPEIVEAAE